MLVAPLAVGLIFLALAFIAWRRYLWGAETPPGEELDECPYRLTDRFSRHSLATAPHQTGIQWLSEVFSRSAEQFPDLTALHVAHSGESLTYSELDSRAEEIAAAVAPFLSGPDQVVGVAMDQDNCHIVAAHLGILKAGGVVMFVDTAQPQALVDHMLDDADPVVILTLGDQDFDPIPNLDLLALPPSEGTRQAPTWLDDPTARLAAIFYTSGTSGKPKGVECPHAGYVNLALTYADAFGLTPGLDATSLTSSLGYDGSISEMYSAWVSGCTVVLLTKEDIRSGPDLIPMLREAEVTVLFCPPVLLSTLTDRPEIDLPYPLCRYIVPAGEAFPGSLVEPWTRGRRQIINTYGPTEASTDTSRQALRADEAITIGSPFPNVTYLILEVEGTEPLPHGEVGELCIGGIHLARGYRNLPELTARKFIDHPRFGRLYRTGDKCRIDPQTRRVHFLGRVDAQLKVRGHRVEIQPVEDILQTQFREIESAVLDYQNHELVAFVAAPSLTPDSVAGFSAAPPDWTARTTAILAEQLPEPSIPSRFFVVEQFVLQPRSGKIDRRSLPKLAAQHVSAPSSITNRVDSEQAEQGSQILPATHENDHQALEVLTICRSLLGESLGWNDQFADHGGHSIVIAQLAQRLHEAGQAVPVRALLSDCNTARKIADHLNARSTTAARSRPADRPFSQRSESREEPNQSPSVEDPRRAENEAAAALGPVRFTAMQILFLALLYSPFLLGFLGLIGSARIGEFFLTASLWEFVVVGCVLYCGVQALPFVSLLWVRVVKIVLARELARSRLVPGSYPKWSRMHLRTWMIGRLEESVLRPMRFAFRSAPLMSFMLRKLGADVGMNLQCAADAEISGPLTLLSIEDDVAIQTGAQIRMSKWVDGQLHLGPVHLATGCKIGMRAAIANSVSIGRDSWIPPFTPILEDVGSGEIWEGAPARFIGAHTTLKRPALASRCRHPDWLLEVANIAMQIFFDFCLMVLPTAAISWFAATFISVADTDLASRYFVETPLPEILWQLGLYGFATSWGTIVLVSVLTCLFLRLTKATAGLSPSRGLGAALLLYRIRKMNQIQRQWTWTITGQYLRALAGVRFPRVGASECDVMVNLVPELTHADSQVFWCHGCYTNMLDYGAHHVHLHRLDMPKNFFNGNNSVAEHGQFPANFLLGVSTPANDQKFRRQLRTRLDRPRTVAGNPPLDFASTHFETSGDATSAPTFTLFAGRLLLNDILGIGTLQMASMMFFVFFYTSLLRFEGSVAIRTLTALLAAELALVVLAAAAKKVLVGKHWGRAHSTPFWSWRHFTYFFAQDCFFAWCRRPLRALSGTVLTNTILRMMGCHIGRRALLGAPEQAADWNAVSVGDDCVVDGFLQLHSFEHMTLKVKRTEISARSSVNFGATLMGGAVVEPDSTLLPTSLVLKEMHLPSGIYEGSPAERTEPAADSSTPTFDSGRDRKISASSLDD